MTNEKIKIIAVGGPTASGKSAVALELAKLSGGEIVSCDSMQVYRKMNIGTAKPTEAEMCGVPHHMIDVCDPDMSYSAADFAEGAAECIKDIVSRGKLPIICGGTGMYLDALLRPTAFSDSSAHETEVLKIREELMEYADAHGKEALFKRLQEIDPEAAAATHPNNVKRVARALEIFYSTGITKTESDRMTTMGESPYDCTVVTLDYACREILYSRINRRVDEMMRLGLLDEVKSLFDDGIFEKNTTAAQAIGYKEFFPYLTGESTLETCIETLKKNTRNYAKRQITWFKRYDGVKLVPDGQEFMGSESRLALYREILGEM